MFRAYHFSYVRCVSNRIRKIQQIRKNPTPIPTHIQVLLRPHLDVVLIVAQPIVDHIVRALAVQHQLAVPPQYHRHPLAHIVEVQYAEQLVLLGPAAYLNRYRVGRARPEHKAEIAGGRHQCRFVRTLRLILKPAVTHLRHDRVTDGEQPKEVVHMLVVRFDGLEQRLVEPAEIRLVLRIEGEVERFGFLPCRWNWIEVSLSCWQSRQINQQTTVMALANNWRPKSLYTKKTRSEGL